MVAEISEHRQTTIAFAGQRVIFTAKKERRLTGVGGKQAACVIHCACKHAVFVNQLCFRGQERPLQLLSSEKVSSS